MNVLRPIAAAGLMALVFSVGVNSASVSLKISGAGAINDSTIKAGKKVTVELHGSNDTVRSGFTMGFAITSKSIKNIVHVSDSGNGINKAGDVKGYNGWQDKSVWDFGGVFVVETDWDGKLPDLIGFGGLCVKKQYDTHDESKLLSFDIIVSEAGTIVIDSAFFPPGGRWLYSPPPHQPEWGGPYEFKVVK